MNWFTSLFGRQAAPVAHDKGELTPRLASDYVSEARKLEALFAPYLNTYHDGDKFPGGFGATQLQTVDYWTLRARSAQLFNDNLYAKGLIRRLITNEVSTGLTPEAIPDESTLGLSDDEANDWSEMAEGRFTIWSRNAKLCDYYGEKTFGAIQRDARREALIEGDVLVVLHQSAVTKLPLVELISGRLITTPLTPDSRLPAGNEIKHGVEFDTNKRRVAYWVEQKNGKHARIAAYGRTSGRKQAWLIYGTEKRLDECRGQPLLAIVLQSLKEIDRYRDSAQRKAVINSILAMFIKKTEDKLGTLPISNGAVRKDAVKVEDSTGPSRSFNIANQIPGVVLEELQQGEEPVGFNSNGTDVSFGQFEEAIIQAVAWANEVPPEILRLAFSNNYSASQAAINEFKIYLNGFWSIWGESFCTPIYIEHMISEALTGKVNTPGLLEAWRDPKQYDKFAAWTMVDWYGSIKPSTDTHKQARGSEILVDRGWSTNAREARVTTGTKFSRNIKRLKRENQLLADAMAPLREAQAQAEQPPAATPEQAAEAIAFHLRSVNGED